MKIQKGFAAILIIFILGLVSLSVACGLILTGSNESQGARSGVFGMKAFYIANSGIEEAIYKIMNDPSYGYGSVKTFQLPINPAVINKNFAKVSVTGTQFTRNIDSVAATADNYLSSIHAEVFNDKVIENAVQAGDGGVEIENNAFVLGNVYSNASVIGVKNNCGNVDGSVTAVGSISNICITNGTAYDNNSVPQPGKIDFPYSDDDILKFQNNPPITKTVTGDCYVGGSTSDCSKSLGNDVYEIGDQKIIGNLKIDPKVKELQISGPVLVIGVTPIPKIKFPNVNLTSNDNTTFMIPGNMEIQSGTIFSNKSSEGKSILFMISTSDSIDCITSPAMDFRSNIKADHTVFFARNGCIYIKSGAGDNDTVAFMGYKIYVQTNTTINYDSALSTALKLWQITSFKRQ
jgi:hypothetical protein